MANTHSAEAGAILPDLCAQAKGAWYVLLGFLAFYAVTIMSTTDADFLVGSRQISIALLGVSVPTERFFFLAPIVAIVLYSNLHYYCLKIWSAAAVAPPETLKARAALIPDLALFLRRDAQSRGGDRWAALPALASALLLWAATPALLVVALVRSRAASDAPWLSPVDYPHLSRLLPSTVEDATVLAVSLTAAIGLASLIGALAIRYPWLGRAPVALAAAAVAFFVPFSELGDWARATAPGVRIERQTVARLPDGWPRAEESRETLRAAWCRDQELDLAVCAVRPASAREAIELDRLRKRFCLTDWGSRNTDWCNRRFRDSDLAFAAVWRERRTAELDRIGEIDLTGRDLDRVAASGAQFTRARMAQADLTAAALAEADLEGANLLEAALPGASAYYAVFDRANLTRARLDRADLTSSSFEGTALVGASLRGARLIDARLPAADLTGADLTGADLTGALLLRADLTGAILTGALLDGATLAGVQGLTQEQLERAVGDAATVLPPRLALAACWVKPPGELEAALGPLPPEAQGRAWRKIAAHVCPPGTPPRMLPPAAPPPLQVDLEAYRRAYEAERLAEVAQVRADAPPKPAPAPTPVALSADTP